MSGAATHPSLDELLAWWLGESDAAAGEATDLHLLGCDECGALVDEIVALREGLRAAFEGGQLRAFVDAAFVERLRGRGKRVREYQVPPDGGVNCSVAPDDDVVVGRMRFPAAGYDRIDVIVRSSLMAGERRIEDVPFDAARGELLSLPRLDRLREAPAHREELELRAVEADGERPLGRYVFNHRPWAGAADGGDGAP